MAVVKLEAVTFDFWNTIGVEAKESYPRRITECLVLLAEAGHPPDRPALERWFAGAIERWKASWVRGEIYSAEMGVRDCAADLGLDLSDDYLVRLAATMGSADIDAVVTPNVQATVRLLKQRGLRLGVICDTGFSNGRTVRSALTKFGLLDAFDCLIFSDEVGAFKPAGEVFDLARQRLGVDRPSRLAHVGDTHRSDVVGATQAGWTAVRYTGVVDDPGEPDAPFIVKDHADLIDVLEIGGRG